MKKTSPNVPNSSATYAAGPRSGMISTGSIGGPAGPAATPGSETATSPPRFCRFVVRAAGQSNQPHGQYSARVLRRAWPMFLLVLALVAPGCGGENGGTKRLTLALDFTPNAAHAGIYQAVAGNWDEAHGLDLVVRQPSASTDSLKLLASGRADIAVVDIHDLGL